MTKINVKLPTEYDTVFLDVARLITQEPPQWLPLSLQHFRLGPIGDYDWLTKKMIDAVDVLLRYLPAFEYIGPLTGEVKEVRVVMARLPGIKRDLEQALRKKDGRPLDIPKQFCAAVVLEASTLAHGSAQPHSLKFKEACAAYWAACGGEPFNDVESWRWPIQNALKMDREWIRSIMTAIVTAVVGNTP